jgi:hypothetical protein
MIHHINENKEDNSPENLYLFKSSGEHTKYHYALKKGAVPAITQSNLISVFLTS